jgi:hypothetical protein
VVERSAALRIGGAFVAAKGLSLNLDLGAEFDDLSCRHAEKGG